MSQVHNTERVKQEILSRLKSHSWTNRPNTIALERIAGVQDNDNWLSNDTSSVYISEKSDSHSTFLGYTGGFETIMIQFEVYTDSQTVMSNILNDIMKAMRNMLRTTNYVKILPRSSINQEVDGRNIFRTLYDFEVVVQYSY